MPEVIETKPKRKRGWCNDCCGFCRKKEEEENVQNHSEIMSQQANNEAADTIFTKDLTEPLKPGSCIIIRGTIKLYCKRFSLNLLYVKGSKSDIVFHFNPRLALRYIVRNSFLNNSWGEEETTSIEKFHLHRNKTFELQIVATEHEFLVALDGRHICAYVYRTPLEKVNKIQVEGIEIEGIDVFQQIKIYPSVEGLIEVENVTSKNVNAYPVIPSDNKTFIVPMGHRSEGERLEDQNLVIPITASLPNGFKTGWQLEITGRVKILPSAFYINLQQGNTLWPHPMIPLHLNPRFYTSYGNHLFVRNSWMNGEWGTEERTAGFQFTPGKWFHLAIRMNADSFGVWIDGILAGEFQFRTPVDTIDTVYIHGDVQVKHILMKDHIDDEYFTKSRDMINKRL
ncbi:hypothetical protein ABEB36_004402 [Hypothenemus hampei]|uniref:Galectin n=1 Tax=Hypothenemus hampei TaxID=57062 RepID=A0ABD1F700_HYPHA